MINENGWACFFFSQDLGPHHISPNVFFLNDYEREAYKKLMILYHRSKFNIQKITKKINNKFKITIDIWEPLLTSFDLHYWQNSVIRDF